MVESLNFQCPPCGTPLSLPASAAGIEGPCPRCRQVLTAPDPWRDLRSAPLHAGGGPQVEPAFRPFVEEGTGQSPPQAHAPDPPPAQSRESNPNPIPDAPEHAAERSSALPQALILLCSILITAVVSLTAGYLLGLRSGTQESKLPTPFAITAPPAADDENVSPAPPPQSETEAAVTNEPAPGKTNPQPNPATPPSAPSAIETAEATLRSFLDAPDWTSRSPFIVDAGHIQNSPPPPPAPPADGPIEYLSISPAGNPPANEAVNGPLSFQVITAIHPRGFPVQMHPTSDGWKLDWRMFVELRDDLFRSLSDGPAGHSGTFHLLVSKPPAERAARTENEHFSSFLIAPPLPERQQLAYVNKTSGAHAILRDATAGGHPFPAVLEVAKRSTPDGKTYLEISSVIASDWTPATLRK